MVRAGDIERDDPVDEPEILELHAGRGFTPSWQRRVRRCVCTGSRDEILLGRRAALVDLLGPLFERHLDPERLVDREGDVQEVEAVDPKVIDRVAPA